MLLMKFEKTENAVFVAHTDVINSLIRALRRLGLEINYSGGFHPHILIFLSPPIPLGIRSLSEWACIDAKEEVNPEEFLASYNKNSPCGLKGLACYSVDKNPNIAGICCEAEYELLCPHIEEKEVELRAALSAPFYIEINRKGTTERREVSGLIRSVEFSDNKLKIISAFGNQNLRMDAFINAINEKCSLNISLFDVTKKAVFVKGRDGRATTVESFIEVL